MFIKMEPRIHVEPEDFLVELKELVRAGVKESVRAISSQETAWSEYQLSKRVTGYICKAAGSPSLPTSPWEPFCESFVKNAMASLCGACWGRQWLPELDLDKVLARVAYESVLFGAEHELPELELPSYDEVRDVTDRSSRYRPVFVRIWY